MPVVRYEARPRLRNPVFVAAFHGWNDGGSAATLAASFLRTHTNAERFAVIDPDDFVDFQQSRPRVMIEDDDLRVLSWPETEFFHGTLPASNRDVIVCIGVEPNLRWRAFSSAIAELCLEHSVEVALTLGGLLADTPHTRPVPISGAVYEEKLAAAFDFEPSRYEGPTGIIGVLHDSFVRARIPSASLWAAVPHYIGGTTNPAAALELVHAVEEVLDVDLDASDLEGASSVFVDQIGRVVESDPEMASYVKDLEARSDADDDEDDDESEEVDEAPELDVFRPSEESLPSGDDLASDFQRFLREQRGNEDAPGEAR
jgi:proteasome assembly chaperone (PAC2) family protein